MSWYVSSRSEEGFRNTEKANDRTVLVRRELGNRRSPTKDSRLPESPVRRDCLQRDLFSTGNLSD